ncbi:hypothetical protein RHGRI_000968 [Rhododendron griersonianum]|uniref:Small auxin up regulated protein n=1 Tax=Rhododendron griersonianum TaxID=479676 RepID=A0AAV6LII9_9ERIC|nr:hypothetical protein RHGRI_000968 [Rhododendron griersonianum]
MASATKNVNKISQIVRLKQVMQRWKHVSLNRLSSPSRSDRFDSDSDSTGPGRRGRVTPSGRLAVYAGPERRRFVIPTRYLNLPVFLSLLDRAEEEFGFQTNGGLVLPCEAEFFAGVVELLERDEQRYGIFGLDDFVEMFSDVGFGSCKETQNGCGYGFRPLLQKTKG